MLSPVLPPIETLDASIGSRVRVVLLTYASEFVGTLVSFDNFVNVVLEDVVEEGLQPATHLLMLLAGNHIAMIVPSV